MGKIDDLPLADLVLVEQKHLEMLARDRLSRGQYLESDPQELQKALQDISRALFLAAEWHAGEVRDNGDPYIVHPIACAKILLTEFKHTTSRQIIGALLHDVKESKTITLERIALEFDAWIAKNVDALSKKDLDAYVAPHESPFYQTQIMMEKFFLSWTRILNLEQEVNIRSFASIYFWEQLRQRRDRDTFWNLDQLDDDELAEKLADRIHNLRTLQCCTPEKQRKIIAETKKYFLPIARIRFPDDGYPLLVEELRKLDKQETSGRVGSILNP